MPIVIPDRSSPITAATVMIAPAWSPASVTTRPVDEALPGPVGDAAQVQLEREALLVAVGAAHVDRLDAVQRLLGQPDDLAILGRDLRGELTGPGPQLGRRHDIEHRPVSLQFHNGNGVARVYHRSHQLLWHEASQMRRCPERATVDLRQPE